MPLTRSDLEIRLHRNRTKYQPVEIEEIRFGKSHSMETRKKISNSMKEYKSKAREGLV